MKFSRKLILTIGAILLLPVLLWFFFGAGIPVTMDYFGLSKKYHDEILGGATSEDMQRWKDENVRK